ncbi:MAG: hypothetical protein ACO3VQ_08495, partial [Ilumatobacteraceae bacterium]
MKAGFDHLGHLSEVLGAEEWTDDLVSDHAIQGIAQDAQLLLCELECEHGESPSPVGLNPIVQQRLG